MIQNTKYKLTIGWLYPDLMSIYGDRGNITVLTKRCEWRGIEVEVVTIDQTTNSKLLTTCDILMMGGAQDRQQTIVAEDLQKKKEVLSTMIEDHVPGLYICGGFQFLGKYYQEADGTIIEQLGVLDVWTENPGGKRLIGNIVIEVNSSQFVVHSKNAINHKPITNNLIVVGFENHGGRTRLGTSVRPLGKVIKGYGSNAEDHTEGAIFKNSIGTYLHGPVLPKNPLLADWLIQKALEKKYGETSFVIPDLFYPERSRRDQESIEIKHSSRQARTIILEPLDDTLAEKAKKAVLKKM